MECYLEAPGYEQFGDWWSEAVWPPGGVVFRGQRLRSVASKLILSQEARCEVAGRGPVVGRARRVDPLETEPWATELWKLEAWREALEEVWKGAEVGSETAAASAMHARAWQLATKRLGLLGHLSGTGEAAS